MLARRRLEKLTGDSSLLPTDQTKDDNGVDLSKELRRQSEAGVAVRSKGQSYCGQSLCLRPLHEVIHHGHANFATLENSSQFLHFFTISSESFHNIWYLSKSF